MTSLEYVDTARSHDEFASSSVLVIDKSPFGLARRPYPLGSGWSFIPNDSTIYYPGNSAETFRYKDDAFEPFVVDESLSTTTAASDWIEKVVVTNADRLGRISDSVSSRAYLVIGLHSTVPFLERVRASWNDPLAWYLSEAEEESFDDEDDWAITHRLGHYLSSRGQAGFFSLHAQLDRPSVSARVVAVALMTVGAVQTIDEAAGNAQLTILLAHLDDARSKVRFGAARGLRVLGDRRALQGLLRQLDIESNEFVKTTLHAAIKSLS